MLDLETLFPYKNNLSRGQKYLRGFLLSSESNREEGWFVLEFFGFLFFGDFLFCMRLELGVGEVGGVVGKQVGCWLALCLWNPKLLLWLLLPSPFSPKNPPGSRRKQEWVLLCPLPFPFPLPCNLTSALSHLPLISDVNFFFLPTDTTVCPQVHHWWYTRFWRITYK